MELNGHKILPHRWLYFLGFFFYETLQVNEQFFEEQVVESMLLHQLSAFILF